MQSSPKILIKIQFLRAWETTFMYVSVCPELEKTMLVVLLNDKKEKTTLFSCISIF